jgi:hypothetical protein
MGFMYQGNYTNCYLPTLIRAFRLF